VRDNAAAVLAALNEKFKWGDLAKGGERLLHGDSMRRCRPTQGNVDA
jgi:hypothetical protein